jgi:ferric-dicitrate binding protein FerR (iron transport regulator)
MDPTDVLLARYVAGECGRAELQEVEALLARQPSLRLRVDELRKLLDLAPDPSPWDVDAIWSNIRARTVETIRPRVQGSALTKRVEPTPHRRSRYAVAAMLVVMAGAGAVFARSRHRTADSEPVPALGNYSTSRGQYATIRLVDGTEVTLGPESRLVVEPGPAKGSREISLQGEAIFHVRHDAAHPLRVLAHGAWIEDIGTRFDVRAYPDEAAVTVAVVEGSVELGRDRGGTEARPARDSERRTLRSGDVGTLNERGQLSAQRSAGASSYLAWATGRLSFVDRPLPDVLRTIGRWYDLELRAPDSRLARRLVTAEFSRQSPSEMIDALAIAVDATVERTGGVITLRPR